MKKSIFGISTLVALSLLVGCVENTGPKLQAIGLIIDPSNPNVKAVVINFCRCCSS